MSSNNLEIHVEGAGAERLAEELQAIFEAELGERPQRIERPATVSHTDQYRGDLAAWCRVILAIPPALLAAVELAEKIELRKKVDRLLTRVKEMLAKNPQSRVTISSPKGDARRLDTAETAEILEICASLASKIEHRLEGQE